MSLTPREAVKELSARAEREAHTLDWVNPEKVKKLVGGELLQPDGTYGKNVILAALEAQVCLHAELQEMLGPAPVSGWYSKEPYRTKRIQGEVMVALVELLLRRKLAWTETELVDLLARQGTVESPSPVQIALQHIKKLVKPKGAKLSNVVLAQLLALAGDSVRSKEVLADRVIRDFLESAAAEGQALRSSSGLELEEGEAWARALVARVNALPEAEQQALLACYYCARDAAQPKPNVAWKKRARAALGHVPVERLRDELLIAFRAVPEGRPVARPGDEYRIGDSGADFLRGSIWLLVSNPWPGLAAALADLAVTSLKKLPFQGPRCIKLANACIWGLGEMAAHELEPVRMSALAHLARLKGRVSFKTTLKAIEKALTKAADVAGVSVEELEELGVPAFGFEGGDLRWELGGATALLTVDGSRILVTWTSVEGKPIKSVPSGVKRDHAEELKELKRVVKDCEAILSGTRARLDGLYLRDASWRFDSWRERYLDHGLVGTLARRLIWSADGATFLATQNGFEDARGAPLELTASAAIRLWHPIVSAPDEVLHWRRRVESLELVQPFKQAHREVYFLTDAERRTEVYSNRFAAHIVKQHQFAALAKGRGWDHALRLMVDDACRAPSRAIPAFGLRAEFWVEPVGGTYNVDTTFTGTYLHLATDQVRFYREGAAQVHFHSTGGAWHATHAGPVDGPLSLDTIPAVVFSEIMRDADLLVGVTSVSNDPSWTDGGREPGQITYWHAASFGELNATAETRRDLLIRLVPKLKIADRCELEERFLRVKGSRRTYKIHLGSANIMMEPNDQYLCIVPDSNAAQGAAGRVFLPFEGDRTLSIILSKAFLLADDATISDPTILSQLELS